MDQPDISSSSNHPAVGVILGNTHLHTYQMKYYPRLNKLVDANREAKTNLYFFAGEDVDLSRRSVNGTYFNYDTSKWERKEFPLPDVLYVRGGAGKELSKLLDKLDGLGVKRVNPIHAFNKGDLYALLKNNDNLRRYLPRTKNVENMDEIWKMLERKGAVYVKACRGRKGTKVMRIQKFSKGYLYSYSILGDLVRKKVDNLKNLQKAITAFFGDRQVIVQQAIDLVKVSDNRLVDFRAEVQRNKNGEIDIVGICVRVGQKNSPITTHSQAYRYDQYLQRLFPHYSTRKINALKDDIKAFLIDIYSGVEKEYGNFGEIGIDFALDKKGEIWLIECNSQSAKVSIVKAYGDEAQRVFLNPLEYAKRIANASRETILQTAGR
jgi:hypothetical protein